MLVTENNTDSQILRVKSSTSLKGQLRKMDFYYYG